jgi:hypothetical protein
VIGMQTAPPLSFGYNKFGLKKNHVRKETKRLHWKCFSNADVINVFVENFAMMFLCGSLIAIATLFSSSALLMKCEILSCRWTRKFIHTEFARLLYISTNSEKFICACNQRKKHVQFGSVNGFNMIFFRQNLALFGKIN